MLEANYVEGAISEVKVYVDQRIDELKNRVEQVEKYKENEYPTSAVTEVELKIKQSLTGMTIYEALEALEATKDSIIKNAPIDEGFRKRL